MSPPWYRKGLKFACTHCNRCCTVEGNVWVTRSEARRLAKHLDLSLDRFGRRFLRLVNGRNALTERSDGACVFWDEGCTVYEARPDQCRTFPFWEENLADRESWREVADECEGIGEGRLYQLGQISKIVQGRGATFDGETPAADDEV